MVKKAVPTAVLAENNLSYLKAASDLRGKFSGLIGLICVSLCILPGCSEPDAPTVNKQDNIVKAEAQAKPNQAGTQSGSKYAFNQWSKQSVSQISVNNVNDVFSVLGMRPVKQKNVLDYSGNLADQYQLRQPHVSEFLNLTNSSKHLELVWIKPFDNDAVQNQAVGMENTHKAFLYARSVLGEKGGLMVKAMVTDTTYKAPQVVNGYRINLAQCDHFYCSIVIEK